MHSVARVFPRYVVTSFSCRYVILLAPALISQRVGVRVSGSRSQSSEQLKRNQSLEHLTTRSKSLGSSHLGVQISLDICLLLTSLNI